MAYPMKKYYVARHWCGTFLVVALLSAGCVTGHPREFYPAPEFLLYSEATPAETDILFREAQVFIKDLQEYLGLDPLPNRPLRINHFRRRLDLWKHLNRSSPSLRWRKGACYETPEAYVVAICGKARKEKVQTILRHELTHYLLSSHFLHLPPWIDEGLAQVLMHGAPFPGLEDKLLRSVRSSVRKNRGEVCRPLVLLPASRPLNRSQYRIACALTYYLLTNSDQPVSRLLCYLKESQPDRPNDMFFSSCWGISPEEACRALVSWAE